MNACGRPRAIDRFANPGGTCYLPTYVRTYLPTYLSAPPPPPPMHPSRSLRYLMNRFPCTSRHLQWDQELDTNGVSFQRLVLRKLHPQLWGAVRGLQECAFYPQASVLRRGTVASDDVGRGATKNARCIYCWEPTLKV